MNKFKVSIYFCHFSGMYTNGCWDYELYVCVCVCVHMCVRVLVMVWGDTCQHIRDPSCSYICRNSVQINYLSPRISGKRNAVFV